MYFHFTIFVYGVNKKKKVQWISVREIYRRRWMKMINEDRTRYEYTIERLGVAAVVRRMRKNGLTWFGQSCYKKIGKQGK